MARRSKTTTPQLSRTLTPLGSFVILTMVGLACPMLGGCRSVDAPPYDFELYWLDGDSDSEFESETDTATPAECESALIPSCGETAYLLPPIVLAADFGDGVRFVDADSMAILAERETDDGFELLVLARRTTWDIWSEAEIVGLPLGEGRAVDLTGPFKNQPFRHVVLVCFADGSCQLYAVGNPWDDPMEIWPVDGGFVPAEWETRGFTGGDESYEECLVVHGNGVYAFGGSWVEIVPGSGDPRLNALSRSEHAVGDAGRLVKLSYYQPETGELDSGTEEDLLSIVDWGSGIAFGASDGRLGWRGGDSGETDAWYAISEEPIVALESKYSSEPIFGLTADGCAFEAGPEDDDDEPCVSGVMPEPGCAIAIWPCADVTNVSYLGESGLYGFWDCIHIH